MKKFCTCLIFNSQLSHPDQLALYNFPEQRSQNVQMVIPFGKVSPTLPEVETHLGKLQAHLNEVGPHFDNFPAHLAKVSPHLGKHPAHLGELGTHLAKLPAHLGEVRPHPGKLSTPFGGFPAENESFHSSPLAPRRLATAPQTESASLRRRCGVLLNRFFHPSPPRQEVALIS
jgi:hypothetical protein